MELFKVAIFHQGFDCQTLRLIDEKIELEKQKAFCKILNQNAQIGTQKIAPNDHNLLILIHRVNP